MNGESSIRQAEETSENRPGLSMRNLPAGNLGKYYKPEEINGHCERCPRFGLNWSCPPHGFDIPEYLAGFTHACVICVEIPLSGFREQPEALEYYHRSRDLINRNLLAIKNRQTDSEILIAGHCGLCSDCSRAVSEPCRFPGQLCYSFESLGFKVSDILEDLFGRKLHWSREAVPGSLNIVAGILSGGPVPEEPSGFGLLEGWEHL